MLKKIPPPLVGELGEKFWLGADVVLGQGCWSVGEGCACVACGGGGEILNPEKEHVNHVCSIDR